MSVVKEVAGHGLERPVLKLGVDKKASYKLMLQATIRALGLLLPRGNFNTTELVSIITAQARGQKVRVIVFDDCQHISENRSHVDPYDAADAFKVMMKQARVQVACVGLDHATDFLLANGQLGAMKNRIHRMKPFGLDLAGESPLRTFLDALSSELPFDLPSSLGSSETATRIHMATQGYVGVISKVVGLATRLAISAGDDRVTHGHLATVQDRLEPDLIAENPFRVKATNPAGYERRRKELRIREANEMRKRRAGRNRAGVIDQTRWASS